jgi:hypothetical protein
MVKLGLVPVYHYVEGAGCGKEQSCLAHATCQSLTSSSSPGRNPVIRTSATGLPTLRDAQIVGSFVLGKFTQDLAMLGWLRMWAELYLYLRLSG